MGARPKSQDYQASAAEQASASTAMAEYQYFKQKYDPLLQQMRDQSLTADVQSGLRGRAGADAMQALTAQPSYQQTQSPTLAGDLAQAYQGQLGVANVAAKGIQNQMQTNVLGTARGQAADAQTGMAQASRLATSEALTRARANQDVAQAKINAAANIASDFLGEGTKNIQGGGTFFTPNMNAGMFDSSGNPMPTRLASNIPERLRASRARGG